LKRSERRQIEGASGHTISADGIPRRWSRLIEITKDVAGLPTITLDSHAYLRPIDTCYYLLDEIVCYEFNGRPSTPLAAVTVTHFDGDMLNCRADNLAWRVDPEWLERQNHIQTLRTMPRVNLKKPPSRGFHPFRRIFYFGA
jgi:hypothetical protein